jgi:hypothetical protein
VRILLPVVLVEFRLRGVLPNDSHWTLALLLCIHLRLVSKFVLCSPQYAQRQMEPPTRKRDKLRAVLTRKKRPTTPRPATEARLANKVVDGHNSLPEQRPAASAAGSEARLQYPCWEDALRRLQGRDKAAHKLIQDAIKKVYNSNEAGDDLGNGLLRAFRDKITRDVTLEKEASCSSWYARMKNCLPTLAAIEGFTMATVSLRASL